MKYIYIFTLVGDDLWRFTTDECDIDNVAQMCERIAELTNIKVKESGEKRKVEKAFVFSENFEFIAYSMDVRIPHSLHVVKNEILNSK